MLKKCILIFHFHFLGDFFSEYKVHSYNRNGLCALAFMDDHYPVRSAFSLLNKVNLNFCYCKFNVAMVMVMMIKFTVNSIMPMCGYIDNFG